MVDSPELSAGDAAQIVGIILLVLGIFGTVALMPPNAGQRPVADHTPPDGQADFFSSFAPWGPVLLGLGITLIIVGAVMNAIRKRRPRLPTSPPSPATPPVTIESAPTKTNAARAHTQRKTQQRKPPGYQ
jgi:hypothetical protein